MTTECIFKARELKSKQSSSNTSPSRMNQKEIQPFTGENKQETKPIGHLFAERRPMRSSSVLVDSSVKSPETPQKAHRSQTILSNANATLAVPLTTNANQEMKINATNGIAEVQPETTLNGRQSTDLKKLDEHSTESLHCDRIVSCISNAHTEFQSINPTEYDRESPDGVDPVNLVQT
jgi:hypothetical protein